MCRKYIVIIDHYRHRRIGAALIADPWQHHVLDGDVPRAICRATGVTPSIPNLCAGCAVTLIRLLAGVMGVTTLSVVAAEPSKRPPARPRPSPQTSPQTPQTSPKVSSPRLRVGGGGAAGARDV